MKVTEKKTGREIKPGDEITSFRGEKAKFLSVTRGPSESRSAKVYVQVSNGKFEYNANVFDLEISE